MKNLTLLALFMLCVLGCKEPVTPVADQHISMATAGLQIADLQSPTEKPAQTVYICVSTGAKRYHPNRNCSGLKRCTHKIEKTTATEAAASGLTLCKLED